MEGVRRQEREIAAEVAEAHDHVVGVTTDVLFGAGEHDEVVQPSELVPGPDTLEVLVGNEVDALPRARDEPDKRAVTPPKVMGTPLWRYGRERTTT